jgi:hypothetical protein
LADVRISQQQSQRSTPEQHIRQQEPENREGKLNSGRIHRNLNGATVPKRGTAAPSLRTRATKTERPQETRSNLARPTTPLSTVLHLTFLLFPCICTIILFLFGHSAFHTVFIACRDLAASACSGCGERFARFVSPTPPPPRTAPRQRSLDCRAWKSLHKGLKQNKTAY